MKAFLNKIPHFSLLILFLLTVNYFQPPKGSLTLSEASSRREIVSLIDKLRERLKSGEGIGLSEMSESILREEGGIEIFDLASLEVRYLLSRGIVKDRKQIEGFRRIFLRKGGNKFEISKEEIIDLKEARKLLEERAKILFGDNERKSKAYIEVAELLLFANLTPERTPFDFLGRVGLLVLILSFSFLFVRTHVGKESATLRKLLILFFSGVLVLISYSLVIRRGWSPYLMLLPFFAIVVNVTIDMNAAFFFTSLLALILGTYAEMDFRVVVFGMLVGWTGILATQNFKSRYQIYLVILIVAIVGCIATSTFTLLEGTISGIKQSLKDAGITAFLSGLMVMVILPIFEKLFRISTDFLLLELSNLNNSLMRELFSKAPGTFTHSLLIGNLGEAAARAIGGNALLTRVAAYYHDIGKTKFPEYFIENRLGKTNPHDLLDPVESKEILLSHVKEGVKIAKKAHLPREIVRIIETHHGTSLMVPFYSKALEKDPMTKEESYRYPGPKPRTKEEAICMLADAVEAATRSLENPTPEQIRRTIREIIENKLEDGQLDEVDLTKKDLQRVQEAFYNVLQGVFHPRIEYPSHGKSNKSPR